MDTGYDISSLTVADQHLFNALKTAQTSQGLGVPLVETPYSSETTCEIVDDEIEYDPKFEYTIQVPRSIYRKPWQFQQAIMQDSVANVLFEDSETLDMPSNMPLSGYYFIECYEPNDPNPRFTDAIKWSASRFVVYDKIIGINACPGLRNKFEVAQRHTWFEDSLNWLLFFEYVDGNLPQFMIHFVQDSLAYSGHQSFVGVNSVIANSEINSRGGNVYYPVLPFDYLFTDETKPQITVTVDGMPALCASLECDYTYEPVGAEVSSMTVTGTSVVITGTSLTSTISSVTIAGMACDVQTSDATTLSCQLPYILYAGSHKPVVKDAKGLIPNASGLTATVVPLVVSAVFPVTEINTAGGSEITIQGSGFPSITGLEDVSLTFSDG